MQYRGTLFGPIYGHFGTPAELVLTDGTSFTLTAIDLTVGLGLAGPSELETLNPRALMLQGDLIDAGAVIDNLDSAILTLNGVAWRITGFQRKPTVQGQADGEVELFLERAP